MFRFFNAGALTTRTISKCLCFVKSCNSRAPNAIRTRDLILTMDALYQLSYRGITIAGALLFYWNSGLFRHGYFCTEPDVLSLAVIRDFIVLYKLTTNFKVVCDFPAYLTHMFFTHRTFHNNPFVINGAGWRIRTSEDISQQIYSLSCLTASLTLHIDGVKVLEPPVGFEPTTFTLQKCCSTTELRRPRCFYYT